MKNTAATFGTLFFLVSVLFFANSRAVAQKPRDVTIGIVIDGASARDQHTVDAVKHHVQELAANKYKIAFPENKMIDGQFDAKKISAGIDQLLADPEVTLVYTLGTIASHNVGQRERLNKPVVAPFIIDRKLQGMPYKKGTSGRKNLNYLDWPWSVERDLAVFHEVAAPTKVVVLASKFSVQAIPGLGNEATKVAEKTGFAMKLVPVGASVDAAVAAIPAGTDGVYLAPLPHLSEEDQNKLLTKLAQKRIATFALLGERAVRGGALVGRLPNAAVARIARRVALHTLRILGGQDAGQLSVALQLPEEIFINMKTARAIGLSPSFQVMTEAQLIDSGRTDIARKVSLTSVMKEAMQGNLNIKALEQVVASGRANVRNARSNLLPSLDLSSDGRIIDKDRAESSFGNSPERLATGSITLNQVIFSEKAWGGLTAEKHLQKNRRQQLLQTQWDVAAEVGAAYLTILRAKAAERIRRSNLKVTRANLDLARIRVDAGSSSQADVYRWQVQINNDRRAVIDASAQRNVAEIDLQRILHRPTEERFITEDVGLPSDGMAKFVNNPRSFRLLREFLVKEAIARSPEVRQLDAAIAAQKRALKSAKRAFYAPTLALQASATQRLYRGGAGSENPANFSPDGLEWFAGLNLSLPLFAGGSRFAEVDRNNAEVARLSREREFAVDTIAQRAASQMHLAGASHAGIRLAQQAETAAKKNYELVATSYSQGAVRIVDLLDAQREWVSAQQVAADSVYGFLIDWINVQRAIGQFSMLLPVDEQRELGGRARAYITERTKGTAPAR